MNGFSPTWLTVRGGGEGGGRGSDLCVCVGVRLTMESIIPESLYFSTIKEINPESY